ncbi:hypothetical protein PG994_007910 [Apiospora phragmitis]|uniref:Ankyrin repeat protein n=1 Tax=Apiospora phragmitis TaxID=2905665 RepID=A0ABR1URI7_9PEZI
MSGTKMGQMFCDPEKRAQYVLSAEDMLRTLLRMGADPNVSPGWPPLQEICFLGRDGPHWDGIVDALVSYGAGLGANTPGKQPRTPLHCVCQALGPVNVKRLERLVELGSPVNAVSPDGDTALSILRRRNQTRPCHSLQAGMEILKNAGAVLPKDIPQSVNRHR